MGGFLFLRMRTKFTFEVAARALRGSAAYPRHGMGPCCFPTFTLCSHVVQGLAVLWGSLWPRL